MIDLSLIEYRYDIPKIIKDGGIALELGVAEGGFSEAILQNSNVGYLYSIDMYANDRGHDNNQYLRAVQKLDKYRHKQTLIKSRFSDCLKLFPENYFDFIYIDGYAHDGLNRGKILKDWWNKLKIGGIFCGDDYSDNYPLVKKYVNDFAQKLGVPVTVIKCKPEKDWASKQFSWLIGK